MGAGRIARWAAVIGAVALTLGWSAAASADEASLEKRVAALEATVAQQQSQLASQDARIEKQEAIEDIRRVAFSYGYYMDNALMSQIEDLFASKMDYCELAGYGLYKGRDGCIKIWTNIIGPGLQNKDGHLRFGRLIKHYLVKDIIVVADDGKTAVGRFDYIGYSGILGHTEHTSQQLGVYRMGFVKEDGVWKINRFDLSFDTSDWSFPNWPNGTILRCPRPNAPAWDGAPKVAHPFPETAVVPFEFPNPVTGKPVPDYVNPVHYWQGNWDGEFGGPACGPRPDAPKELEPSGGVLGINK